MSRRVRLRLAVGLTAVLMGGGAAGAAHASQADDPTITFDTASQTVQYGQYWYFQATAQPAPGPDFWQAVEAAITPAPSGYAVEFSSYKVDEQTVAAYVSPQPGARPLPPGTYTTTVTLGDQSGGGVRRITTPPASLTIEPAPLGVDLRIGPDPSNPANAIVSARFTGEFVDNYFSSTDPTAGLTPAGAWKLSVSDADGQVVHELSQNREAGDDVLGVSSYWSDVPPGSYTATATFTPSGASAQNFVITQPAPATFAPAPQPGTTSTAAPAPPAPPASEDAGLTLPGWIPILAGVLTAGLLALMIVQIVRLRRAVLPRGPEVAA
ncbi:MAG: hypothetical protein ABIQ01_12275 [Pseudolysinimonas sp.]